MASKDFQRILTGELTVAGLVDEILQRVIESSVQKVEHHG